MDATLIIPLVFLSLIVILVIYALIFMKSFKKDKQRLTSLFSSDNEPIKHESLYLEMANSYLSKGNKEKALEYYYLYLRKEPNNGKVCYTVATILEEADPEEAQLYYQKADKLGYQQKKDQEKEDTATPEETPANVCPQCNNEVPEGSIFCIKCGEKLNQD